MKTNKFAQWPKKTLGLVCVGLATSVAPAQTTANSPVNNPALPPPSDYQMISQDGNSRVWQRTTYEQAPDGAIHPHLHSYTEIASGLNFWNGQWTASVEQVLPSASGATAQQGPYQINFANNLNTAGAITHSTADGLQLRSSILCLAYEDTASGQTVVIGQIKDCQGEIISATGNQVLYPDAFSGVKCDIRYTYTKSSFEQEVIVKEQLASPEAFGLSSASTDVQIFTEFIDPPPATLTKVDSGEQLSSGLEPDQGISWGATVLGRGRAFDLGDNGQVPVSKEYTTINGRQILIEKVRYTSIQACLAKLPEQASINKARPVIAARKSILPKTPLARKEDKSIKYAKVSPAKGFVLDYISLGSAYTNYTFQGDTTYFLSGNLNLLGTNYFEKGSVIKFSTNTAIVEVPSPFTPKIVFESTPFCPVLFSAKDDNTFGEPIGGSTGNPIGYYASPALNLPGNGAQSLSDFEIAYANPAISASGASPTLYDAQLFHCGAGISLTGGTANLENVLFSDVSTNFVLGLGGAVVAQQLTFNNAASLTSPTSTLPDGASLALTNCVLVNVTNAPGAVAADFNGFFNSPAFGYDQRTNTLYPLQSVLGGGCYLTNGCLFHSVGTPNINATLYGELAAKTTYAPVVYSNTVFSYQTNFGPLVPRDTNVSPDLGYHYSVLDYVFGGVNACSNITFSAGTAVGWYNGGPWAGDSAGYGIALNGSAQATFNGTATAPCIFAKTTMVQEGDTGYWNPEGYLGGFTGFGGNNTQATAPTVNFQFTRCYSRGTETAIFRDSGDGTLLVAAAKNSEFYCGEAGGYEMYFLFTNCLSFRSIIGANCTCTPLVTMRNCTYFGGILSAERSGATWPVVVEDCAFQDTDFEYLDDPSGGNTNITWINFNSFFTTNTLPKGERANYVTVTNYNWQTSWFGSFYVPPASPLIKAGSTTANLIGLYHFTTQTNQIPETNAVVDIGYHFVATDPYGNPIDSNGDGIPDYLEDPTGQGLPLSITLLTPTNSATYSEPANVAMQATIFDWSGTVTNVEFFNGSTNISSVIASPYNYTWPVIPYGIYTVMAKAFDNKAATALSVPVNITVTNLCGD